jgi:hypothetical protein
MLDFFARASKVRQKLIGHVRGGGSMMKIGKALQAFAFVSAVTTPFAVLGQPDTGSVTVAPLGTAAPTIGTAMLGVLAVVLAVGAFLVLRRRAATMTAGFVAVALSATVALMTYAAGATTIVMGVDCTKPTTFIYNPTGDQRLQSACARAIEVVDLTLECNFKDTLAEVIPSCVIGLVLQPGEECSLQTCDT